MNTKGLAESIILQSLDDLWSRNHRKESENFFIGDTFCLCADIAEMNDLDQVKMRHMVQKILKRVRRPVKHLKMQKKTA